MMKSISKTVSSLHNINLFMKKSENTNLSRDAARDPHDKDNPNTVIDASQSNSSKKLDPLDVTVGHMGKWQIIILLSLILIKIPLSLNYNSYEYLLYGSTFRCKQSEGNNIKCNNNCTIYDYFPKYKNTLMMELDLQCEMVSIIVMNFTLHPLGFFFGNILFAIIADRYGRRKIIVFFIIAQALIGSLIIFTSDTLFLFIMRVFLSILDGGSLVCFITATEIVGIKYRHLFNLIYQGTVYLNQYVLNGIQIFGNINSLKKFHMYISVPAIALLPLLWLIPESPRWLLVKNKTSEAINVLKMGAKMNKLSTENVDNVINECQRKITSNHKESMISLFRTRNVRCATLILCFGIFASAFSFGHILKINHTFFYNPYANVFANSSIYIIGVLFAIICNDYFGRRITLMASYVLYGITVALTALLFKYNIIIILLLVVIGYIGCVVHSTTILLYAIELYPTIVRNTGACLCAAVAQFTYIVPFLVFFFLDKFHYWISSVLFSIVPLVAAVLIKMLPETSGKVLCDTIDEAEDFLENKSES